jgi:hypothetical protein
MSYNISTWKTKELKNFRILAKDIQDLEDYTRINFQTNIIHIYGAEFSEKFELEGKLVDGWIEISQIHHSGEGSGHGFDELKILLQQTQGSLVATLIWEGGDYISRLTVVDGEISEEGIEL